ncbi:MAG: tetratricopeptide repeat protein, partial [Pseudomonadota bacterium]
PGFALAHVGLADTNTILASYGIRPQDEATPTVRAAIDAALRLDAQLGAAHAAQALHFSGTGRFADAEQAFQRAISLDPNYAPAFHWYGNILVAGLFDPARAVPLLEKARLLDPLSPVIVLTLGEAYDALGRFEEAMAMFRKSIEIEPGFASGYARIAMLYRTVYGRTAESVRWYREELHRDATRDSSFLAFTYLEMGDDERAEFWFRHALDYRPDGVLPQVGMLSLALYRDDNELALARAREFADRFPNVNFGIFALLMLGQHEEVLERYVGQFPLLSCDREVPSVSRANLFQAINLSLALV